VSDEIPVVAEVPPSSRLTTPAAFAIGSDLKCTSLSFSKYRPYASFGAEIASYPSGDPRISIKQNPYEQPASGPVMIVIGSPDGGLEIILVSSERHWHG